MVWEKRIALPIAEFTTVALAAWPEIVIGRKSATRRPSLTVVEL